MNINEILDKATSIAKECSPNQVSALTALREKMRNRRMKVAVLGDFKAGKSTILNQLFLKEKLLPTDYSECTAVPTLLANGSRCIQLWKRDLIAGGEKCVQELTAFDADTLSGLITADSEESRADKASQYSRVSLTLPNILPDNICLVDTPGLNSTNQGIVVGTMAEAMDADVILYVVRGKTLAAREKSLLASVCGMQTMKVPVFVIVTHDETQAPAQVQNICKQIKADLAHAGITAICDSYAFGTRAKHVTDSFDTFETPASTGSLFDNCFDDGEKKEETQSASTEACDLTDRLTSFFKEKVVPGRTARIIRELKPILAQIQLDAASRIQVGNASAEQVAALQNQLRKLRFEYNRKAENMLGDLRAIQIRFLKKLATKIDAIVHAKKTAMHSLSSIQQVSAMMQEWNDNLSTELGNEVQLLRIDLERDIRNSISQFGQDLQLTFSDEEQGNIVFDSGFLSKIPAWAVLVGDYVLSTILSPLPFFIDIPIRYLLRDLPFVPSNLIASFAIRLACNNLDEAVGKIKSDIISNLKNELDMMTEELKAKLSSSACFAETEQALQAAEQNRLTPDEVQNLEALTTELDTILKTL